MSSKLEQIEFLTGEMKKLAERWIKAWPPYNGYSSVGDVKYDSYSKKICFLAVPTTSGIGLPCAINATYLEDSSCLEEDSLKWYEEDWKKRNERSSRLLKLEENPEVKEYLTLKNNLPFAYYPDTNIHL